MPGLYYRQSTPVNNVGIQLSNHFHISHFTPTVCSYLEEKEKRLKKNQSHLPGSAQGRPGQLFGQMPVQQQT